MFKCTYFQILTFSRIWRLTRVSLSSVHACKTNLHKPRGLIQPKLNWYKILLKAGRMARYKTTTKLTSIFFNYSLWNRWCSFPYNQLDMWLFCHTTSRSAVIHFASSWSHLDVVQYFRVFSQTSHSTIYLPHRINGLRYHGTQRVSNPGCWGHGRIS